MAEPQACGQCKFWRKHEHKAANWGECLGILDDPAKLTSELALLNGKLLTNEAFYCSRFEQKPITTKPSLVDTVREAARNYGNRLKKSS